MGTFIASTHAKRMFKVTNKDMESLECVSLPNPYYHSASPMRLYDIRDVARVAVEKRVARMDVDKDVAKGLVKGFSPLCIAAGSCKLPADVLNIIMEKVADGHAEGDLRDTKVVIQELAMLGQVSRDFYIASQHGLKRLAQGAHGGLPECGVDWDKYVRCPQTFTLKQCKMVAQALNMKMAGTKAQVIVRTLAHFCMSVPRNMPARLLLHMKNYQDADDAVLKHMVSMVRTSGVHNLCTANITSRNLRFFAAQSFGTLANLRQAYDNAKALLRIRMREAEVTRGCMVVPCVCGATPAKQCKNDMCKHCCRSLDNGCYVHRQMK